MSVVDPGGGVVTGGVIEVFTGSGAGGAAPDIVIVSGISKILYNGKTITLTRPPFQVHIDPYLQRTVNVTLTGVVETIRRPRVDVMVRVGFRPSTSQRERVQVDNVWQYIQQGGSFRVIIDSDKTVSTTLSAQAAAGVLTFAVSNPSGITQGQTYALVGGPNYQAVIVDSVAGSNVTVRDALDFTFPSGSVFRDWLLWDGVIADPQARTPIIDRVDIRPMTENCFDWILEFLEATPA